MNKFGRAFLISLSLLDNVSPLAEKLFIEILSSLLDDSYCVFSTFFNV